MDGAGDTDTFVPTAAAFQAGRKPTYLSFDTLDDRRELVTLLGKLRPADRWRFVRWCADTAAGAKGHRPALVLDAADREQVRRAEAFDRQADDRITAACYGFVLILAGTWGLSLPRAAGTLVEVVRGRLTLAELHRANQAGDGRGQPGSRVPDRDRGQPALHVQQH